MRPRHCRLARGIPSMTLDPSNTDGDCNLAVEAMHRAYRVLTGQPDQILRKSRLQRAHHRVLYVIARNPGCSVTRVCELLRVTRQAINGPLRTLLSKQMVRLSRGETDS